MSQKRPREQAGPVRKLDLRGDSSSQPDSHENGSEGSEFTRPAKKQVRYSRSCYYDWTTEELCAYLADDGGIDEETIASMQVNMINGRGLKAMTEESLAKLGLEPLGRRLDLWQKIQEVVSPRGSAAIDYKVFNDSIHGHIQMHPLLVAVIDTPQFQRLRWIKQLGISYLVYPGASHNRFEHSLGVAHLAGEFARSLQKSQPELDITDVDIICLEMAGLCHDLGHGPFSHIFDNKFMARVCPDSQWKHEQASLDMFDYMMEQNNLKGKFTEHGLNDRDIIFIKELINGPLRADKKLVGRSTRKAFMYEIVANKRTAIDVDKWDYFARDCHHLGLKSTFDHKRFIFFARVITPQAGASPQDKDREEFAGRPIICCRDKEAKTIYDMFQVRANLHRTAYQHKTNQNLENMLLQALVKANDHLKIEGKGGKQLKISECVGDMEAYSKLTDNIFMDILLSTKPELAESREILLNMQRRKLFKFIGETRPAEPKAEKGESKPKENEAVEGRDQIAAKCAAYVKEKNLVTSVQDWKDELIGQLVAFDFGMGGKNPIDKMRFYSKSDPNTVFELKQHEVSMMLPKNIAECRFRLYCKSDDPLVHEVAGEGMKRWCADKNYVPPKIMGIEFTPQKIQERNVEPSPAPKRRDSLAMNH